jgi:hypothetical protein
MTIPAFQRRGGFRARTEDFGPGESPPARQQFFAEGSSANDSRSRGYVRQAQGAADKRRTNNIRTCPLR